MATNAAFNHSSEALFAGTSQTLLYGPVPSGTTVIVFSGAFANTDTTNQVNHWVTLIRDNGSGVQSQLLTEIPIPFGGTSMCPKIVLLPGEELYVLADTASVVACTVEVVLLT